jgi:thymidylate synthase (FAD)
MRTELVWITPNAESLIAKIARVSNPSNQDNPKYAKLIKYLIDHKHWSPLEMASACISIETNRAIAAQILRHRSFSFQEFSQRYAAVQTFEGVRPRRQDVKNRQNSIDDLPPETQEWFAAAVRKTEDQAVYLYEEALAKGVAKECARFLLPLNTRTHIYMAGTIRSWVHYLQLRTHEDTQLEHREIALSIRKILTEALPTVAEALEWPTL